MTNPRSSTTFPAAPPPGKRLDLLSLLAALPVSAAVIWTGAVDTDNFNEANWDLSGSAVTAIDPTSASMTT